MKTTKSFYDYRRRFWNLFMLTLIVVLALIAILPLLSIFTYVFQRGAPYLSVDFFTHLPVPVGENGGGMGQSFLGSLFLVFLASLIGVPWGIFSGIYIAEYGYGKSAWFLRFTNDLLMGVPSIVIGLFVYSFVVTPMKGFSLMAGALALALIMIPIVSRSTEETLKMTPQYMREAGLALGIPRWRVIMNIIVKGSWGTILTGVILCVARISGETAPLLLTSFNNQYWTTSLLEPSSSLPVQIYTYAISPFTEWQNQAWAGALVLIIFVFTINIFVRLIFKTWKKR